MQTFASAQSFALATKGRGMDRQVGVGVIGLGWMGRVHTSSYRRVLEHFPRLGVAPRLVAAADVSPERRAHAEHVGVERTAGDWRAADGDSAGGGGAAHRPRARGPPG